MARRWRRFRCWLLGHDLGVVTGTVRYRTLDDEDREETGSGVRCSRCWWMDDFALVFRDRHIRKLLDVSGYGVMLFHICSDE